MSARNARGFTLVEVLVALMIVAIGLSALMVAVSGAARTSGYLRDKTLAQWIALNRISEVRLNSKNKFAQNTDAADVDFAGRPWHYDTRYFDTTFTSMKRVVVRVYAGSSKTKGNPLAESSSFISTLMQAGSSNATNWNQGSSVQTLNSTTGTIGTPANPGTNQLINPGAPSNSTAPATSVPTTPTPNPVQP